MHKWLGKKEKSSLSLAGIGGRKVKDAQLIGQKKKNPLSLEGEGQGEGEIAETTAYVPP